MRAFLLCLSFYVQAFRCVAINNTDDWILVDQTDIYQDLDSCAQECVRTVNEKVWDESQSEFCQSSGCVCSNSTKGPNFLKAESIVESCVAESCEQQDAVDRATRAMNNLCLAYSVNLTQPQQSDSGFLRITSEAYSKTTACVKFILNGCVAEDGSSQEPACAPAKKPKYWEDYKGVANQLRCLDRECICRGRNFDVSVNAAFDAGIDYCAMWPSTTSSPNEEVDNMLLVFAEFCASSKDLQEGYIIRYSGMPPGSKTDDDSNSKRENAGIGISAASLLLSAIAVFMSGMMLRFMRRAPKASPDNVPPVNPSASSTLIPASSPAISTSVSSTVSQKL